MSGNQLEDYMMGYMSDDDNPQPQPVERITLFTLTT
jgi:hypothetical protein